MTNGVQLTAFVHRMHNEEDVLGLLVKHYGIPTHAAREDCFAVNQNRIAMDRFLHP